MKKYLLFFITILLIIFNTKVYAACNDEELNEWVVNAKIEFVEQSTLNKKYDKEEDYTSEEDEEETVDEIEEDYAYYLYLTPYRKDIKIKVKDGEGNTGVGTYFKKYDFYGFGCYTNLEEEKYTIEIYGSDDSKCKNELLKTMTYTVPRFNRMSYFAICDDYPDQELCKTFTNETENMSESDFKKAMKDYDKEEKKKSGDIFNFGDNIISYLLFAIIPFIIITIIYFIRKRKIKKIEREK